MDEDRSDGSDGSLLGWLAIGLGVLFLADSISSSRPRPELRRQAAAPPRPPSRAEPPERAQERALEPDVGGPSLAEFQAFLKAGSWTAPPRRGITPEPDVGAPSLAEFRAFLKAGSWQPAASPSAPADISDLIRALKDAHATAPRTASAEMTELLELIRRTKAAQEAPMPAPAGDLSGQILHLVDDDAQACGTRDSKSHLAVNWSSPLRRSDLSGLAAHADIPAGFRTPPGMAMPSPDAILGADLCLSADENLPLGLAWDDGTKAWIS